jgi:hypothetical protein
MNIKITNFFLYLLVLLKTPLGLQQNSMFYCNKSKRTKQIYGISKTKFVVFYYKKSYSSSYSSQKKLCLRIILLPRTFPFGQSQVTSP